MKENKDRIKEKEKMASKQFKKCVPPCTRYIMPGEGDKLYVICLGAEHAHSAWQ